jgi:hypothetical protein
MLTNAKRALVVSLLLGSGLGCGSGGGESAPIPISQVASQGLEAFCTRLVRCGFDPDVAACESAWFSNLQAVYDVSTGKVIYDADAEARCIDGYASEGCTISTDDVGAAQMHTQACRAVFTGTVANGGACFSSVECVSRSCGFAACSTATCCAGTCQAQIAVGGDCSGGAVCVDGTVCREDANNNVEICVGLIAAGQPCTHTNTSVCASGTTCITDPATGASSCGRAPAEGQPCPDGTCDADFDTCDAITEICVRKVAVGGACASSSACVPYATCDPTSSTCVALALAGAACMQDSDCLGGLACDNRICTAHPDTPACM